MSDHIDDYYNDYESYWQPGEWKPADVSEAERMLYCKALSTQPMTREAVAWVWWNVYLDERCAHESDRLMVRMLMEGWGYKSSYELHVACSDTMERE